MLEVEKHRLLIEHLPDAYAYHQLLTDSAGNPVDSIVLDVNRAFEEMFKLPRNTVMGKKITELFPDIKASPFAWLEIFSEAANASENLRFEHYYKPLDRWYDITAYSDEPGFFVVLFRDITESKETKQKKHEQALRESEEKHRRLFETMNQGVIYQYANGTITSANPAAERILGLSLAQMQGKTSMDPHWQMIEEDGTAVPGTEHPAILALKTGQTVGPVTRGVYNSEKSSHVWLNITAIPLFKPGEAEPFQAYATFEDITDRKRAEEVLREGEAKYRLLFNNNPHPMFLYDIETLSFLEANNVAMVKYGYSKEEFFGMTIKDIHPEYEIDRLMRNIESLGDGLDEAGEWRHCLKDGTIIDVEITSHVINYKGRKAEIVLAVDITDRKRAESALAESLAHYDELVSRVPVGIYIVYIRSGGRMEFDYVSDRWCEIHKLHCKDVLSDAMTVNNQAHPDEREDFLRLNQEAFFNQRPFLWEGRFVIGNGELRWLRIESTPDVLANNDVRWFGVTQDITERKQAEIELQENRNLLNSMFQSIQDGISILNADLTIREVNHTIEKWFDYAAPFIGKKCYEAYHGRSEPCDPCPSIRALKEKTVCSEIVPLMGEDKQVGWVEVYAYPLLDKTTGSVNGVVEFVRDITERKRAEQKLAEYTLELEQLYYQLDEEINKARIVHERILPTKLPDIPGITFAPHYQPAQSLGGDFYGIIQKGNKLIFYLSDVSGHGLDGAMLSVFVKHTIKSYISFTPADELSPSAILRHLAEQFGSEDYPEDLYVCLFMAMLDLPSKELTYCGAGLQEALLVQLGSGERLTLHSKGMFITSYLPIEILKLQDNSIKLTPGSTIFCNTDGLTEQESNGTYYRERLPDTFFQNTHLPPHQIAQAVLENFRKFNNGSLQGNDDITFLVLQLEAR